MSGILERDFDPRGGLHVWCRLRFGDSRHAAAAAARAGVVVLAGTAFYPSGSVGAAGTDRLRISLPVSGRDPIDLGVRRLQAALPVLAAQREAGRSGEPIVVV